MTKGRREGRRRHASLDHFLYIGMDVHNQKEGGQEDFIEVRWSKRLGLVEGEWILHNGQKLIRRGVT